jgi:hypothetical protein
MKVQFSTEGAAFKDEYADKTMNDIYTRQETARILKKIASYIESGTNYGSVMDINGNKIGEWSL